MTNTQRQASKNSRPWYQGRIPASNVDLNGTTYGWVAQRADASVGAEIKSIEDGVLFPYTGAVGMYRCPVGQKDEFRSYSIVASMNSRDNSVKGTIYTNLGKIANSSEMVVFICESGMENMKNAFYVTHGNAEWDDLPPLNHSNGTVVSFVDGHSEPWAWQDRDTILLGKGKISLMEQPKNPDLERVQRGVWGSLGYNPNAP